jgi:hypothetical protein
VIDQLWSPLLLFGVGMVACFLNVTVGDGNSHIVDCARRMNFDRNAVQHGRLNL